MNHSLLCHIFVCLLLSFASQASEEFSIADRPDWVAWHAAALADQTTTADAQNSTSYLLYDRQILHLDDTHAEYTRMVSRANTPHGLTELGQLQLVFDPNYQQLTVHQVQIHRGDEIIDVLQDSEFEVIRQETELNADLYHGTKNAVLVIKNLQVGDVLDYSYTINGQNPIFGDHFFGVLSTQWRVPVAEMMIRITTPLNMKIKHRFHHGKSQPDISKTDQTVTRTWQQSDVPALDHQGDYPRWYVGHNFLELSSFNDWEAVTDWARSVFDVPLELDAELHSKISSWQNHSGSVLDQAALALKYVQDDIRYMGIEIGVNSHRPRTPAETHQTRFGDCKDKTMLLHAILAKMGVSSTPALVSTDLNEGLTERLPSPGLFNHVVLRIETDEQAVWVDPTRTHQGTSLLTGSAVDFGVALLVSPHNDELLKMHALPSQQSLKQVTETLVLQGSGEATELAVESSYFGKYAEYLRATIQRSSQTDIDNSYESFVNQLYGPATLSKPFAYTDDSSGNQLTVQEHYQLQQPWNKAGRYEYLDVFASSLQNHVELPARINRDSPLNVSHPLNLEHRFVITGAIDKLELDTQPVVVESDHLLYRRQVEKGAEQLVITHHLSSKTDHVNAGGAASHIEQLKTIKNHLNLRLFRPAAFKKQIRKSNDRLKSALQELLKEKQQEDQQ